MENCERVARDLFARHGITRLRFDPDSRKFSHVLSEGEECHAAFFDGAYVHFHVGYGGWREHLPADAPRIRVRQMTHDGKPIAESEWFSC
jgi:hypothetical protein